MKEMSIADLATIMKPEIFVSDSGVPVRARVYRPEGLACGARVPLFLFLHGAGERGDDNISQFANCMKDIMDFVINENNPAIVIAPQCPAELKWVDVSWGDVMKPGSMPENPSAPLRTVIDNLFTEIETSRVDRSRIYVSGISMGGYGTWDMLCRFPTLFAAGMPLCGGVDVSKAYAIKNIPIRTFHGSLDNAVPVQGTRNIVAALEAAGSTNVEYREFSDAGHDVWTRVYADHENLRWLFSNTI